MASCRAIAKNNTWHENREEISKNCEVPIEFASDLFFYGWVEKRKQSDSFCLVYLVRISRNICFLNDETTE